MYRIRLTARGKASILSQSEESLHVAKSDAGRFFGMCELVEVLRGDTVVWSMRNERALPAPSVKLLMGVI